MRMLKHFREWGQASRTLAGDETGGQYKSPFVLLAAECPALPHATARLVFRN